jgi:hypothetical protein
VSESYHSLLAVVGGDAAEADAVLARAARLAEESHARLTIAAVAHPGRLTMWLAGLAMAVAAVPPCREELETLAQHRLARAAEFMPQAIGLTTMVITEPPRRPIRRLLESGCYDLLVIGAHLAAHRALATVPVPALVVPASDFAPSTADAGAPLPVR